MCFFPMPLLNVALFALSIPFVSYSDFQVHVKKVSLKSSASCTPVLGGLEVDPNYKTLI